MVSLCPLAENFQQIVALATSVEHNEVAEKPVLEGSRALFVLVHLHFGWFFLVWLSFIRLTLLCQLHDALLFQLDTTNTTVSADGRRLLARYGRRWDLVIDVSDGKLETAVARRKPSLAGWFVGRNDTSVHPATTVFVRVSRGRDRTVVTRLRPVEGKISLGRFPKAKDNK